MSKIAEYSGKIGSKARDYASIVSRDARRLGNVISDYLKDDSLHVKKVPLIYGSLSAIATAESMWLLSEGSTYNSIIPGIVAAWAGYLSMKSLDEAGEPKVSKE
jgi:hypothetical protein